jgi:hypothetical protein
MIEAQNCLTQESAPAAVVGGLTRQDLCCWTEWKMVLCDGLPGAYRQTCTVSPPAGCGSAVRRSSFIRHSCCFSSLNGPQRQRPRIHHHAVLRSLPPSLPAWNELALLQNVLLSFEEGAKARSRSDAEYV